MTSRYQTNSVDADLEGKGSRIFESLMHEARLPQTEEESCVHHLIANASCHACAEACPQQAWMLEDNALVLNVDACDGCGLCIPACPNGALQIDFPWIIRSHRGRTAALFACERSAVAKQVEHLPCLHALGLRQLLQMVKSGVECLLIATKDCASCPRQPATGVFERLQQLNQLLRERDRPPLEILQCSSQDWIDSLANAKQDHRDQTLSRRSFLRGGAALIHRELLTLDPLNLDENRRIPPGRLLPDNVAGNVHWPSSPRLDESRCDGCDACMNLCPTGALELCEGAEETSRVYRLDPASCTGCGICADVCESQAVSVDHWSIGSLRTIELSEWCCTACGNPFHLPRRDSSPSNALCQICRHHNNNRLLYQVLQDD